MAKSQASKANRRAYGHTKTLQMESCVFTYRSAPIPAKQYDDGKSHHPDTPIHGRCNPRGRIRFEISKR
jgi:hypothetical protein